MILNAPRNMARAVVWTLLLDDGSAVRGPRVSQRHYFLLRNVADGGRSLDYSCAGAAGRGRC
jgi:hypothetical protein